MLKKNGKNRKTNKKRIEEDIRQYKIFKKIEFENERKQKKIIRKKRKKNDKKEIKNEISLGNEMKKIEN